MLAACAALPALASAAAPAARMGVIVHSFGIRGSVEKLSDPLAFLDYAQKLGAGGVQLGIGVRDADYIRKLRAKVETSGLYLEGAIRLPRDRADLARFTGEVQSARACGVTVLRTVVLPGRRYETFDSAEAFRTTAKLGYESLGLAEPVLAKHDVRLAIENHKDWLVVELLEILKKLSSKHIGVTIDTGNSIALLEEPMQVVEAYAPFAFSTHIKDMGVREYADGFLLAEVPLGAGFLDLKKIIAVLRQHAPAVRFNLEMITRDPLRVPCLTPKYWATLDRVSGQQLAQALARVRRHAAKQPLPEIAGLPMEQKLALEEKNVRQSLDYARRELGL